MKNSIVSGARKLWHRGLRSAFSSFPKSTRFSIYRSFVDCDPAPDPRLVLKIAETKEELEACFKLLHDAYVGAGFMKPHPSGMRVTMYHALPTTTTLCAVYDGEVVGTISLIRESVFGFPLQAVFDLTGVRAKTGQIAEVSALAVHPKFRKTGGAILFPLMKFMYEYSTTYFDTRHLVIAVNPNRIEMYESLLFFQRLTESKVDAYDFANGAPAVGASVDLHEGGNTLKKAYGGKPARKNLHAYFMELKLPNIVEPNRRYFTTNDPVLTPELLDYFFNQRTQGFAEMDERKQSLLHAIYDLPAYEAILPKVAPVTAEQHPLRQHRRFSIKCPAKLDVAKVPTVTVTLDEHRLQVVELSRNGFQARAQTPLPLNVWGRARVQLGRDEMSTVQAMAVRASANGHDGYYGFKLDEPDLAWRKCVRALESGQTHGDLDRASVFLTR